jgi:hypothetical protein
VCVNSLSISTLFSPEDTEIGSLTQPVPVNFFRFATVSTPAEGPTQIPVQWVPGVLSLGVKRQVCEADKWPLSNAEAKNAWGYTSFPP